MRFADTHENIQVFYEKTDHVFRNPSDKRNHQLRRISEEFETPYHVFWLDDDEVIRFRDGKEFVWLRDALRGAMVPLLVDTYAYNSKQGMSTVRFIPGGFGYHFHTERAMCIHDGRCNIIADWTPREEKFEPKRMLQFNDFFIINKWNLRNPDTLEKRDAYQKHEIEMHAKMLPCDARGI